MIDLTVLDTTDRRTDSIEARIMKRAAVEPSRSRPRQSRRGGPTNARRISSMAARPPPFSSAAFNSFNRSRLVWMLRVTYSSAISSSLEPKW
jgi:hypothetical protein